MFSEEDIFISKVPLMYNRLNNGELNGQLNGELNGELNVGQTSVFQCIKNHEGMNASLLSQELKMPFSTVDKHIRILIYMNLIERRGSKKTGGYFTKKK